MKIAGERRVQFCDLQWLSGQTAICSPMPPRRRVEECGSVNRSTAAGTQPQQQIRFFGRRKSASSADKLLIAHERYDSADGKIIP